jgi:hypothetical protein
LVTSAEPVREVPASDLEQRVVECRDLLVEEVGKRELRVQHTEHRVEVRSAEVRIDDHHAFARAAECEREVGRDRALARAALAAGDGDDSR